MPLQGPSTLHFAEFVTNKITVSAIIRVEITYPDVASIPDVSKIVDWSILAQDQGGVILAKPSFRTIRPVSVLGLVLALIWTLKIPRSAQIIATSIQLLSSFGTKISEARIVLVAQRAILAKPAFTVRRQLIDLISLAAFAISKYTPFSGVLQMLSLRILARVPTIPRVLISVQSLVLAATFIARKAVSTAVSVFVTTLTVRPAFAAFAIARISATLAQVVLRALATVKTLTSGLIRVLAESLSPLIVGKLRPARVLQVISLALSGIPVHNLAIMSATVRVLARALLVKTNLTSRATLAIANLALAVIAPVRVIGRAIVSVISLALIQFVPPKRAVSAVIALLSQFLGASYRRAIAPSATLLVQSEALLGKKAFITKNGILVAFLDLGGAPYSTSITPPLGVHLAGSLFFTAGDPVRAGWYCMRTGYSPSDWMLFGTLGSPISTSCQNSAGLPTITYGAAAPSSGRFGVGSILINTVGQGGWKYVGSGVWKSFKFLGV